MPGILTCRTDRPRVLFRHPLVTANKRRGIIERLTTQRKGDHRMRWTPATALAVALATASAATAGCGLSLNSADETKTGQTVTRPSRPSPTPEPALTPQGAQAVLRLYLAAIVKANGLLNPALAAKVESGSALKVRTARYVVYRRNGLDHGLVRYVDGAADAPKFTGYPKWFFAAAVDNGQQPGKRDFLLFVQDKAGAPWRVTYAPSSTRTDGTLAPGVDVVDFPAVVSADDPGLAVPPGKLAAALAHALTNGSESPYAAGFASGEVFDAAKGTLADNRSSFRESGWTGVSRAVDAKTPVYAVRTKSGGALVWFALDLRHDYRSKIDSSGLTWDSEAHGDLHKGFSLPSTIQRSIDRVERYEMVGYIPPKGKGRIHIIAGRWFPLSMRGS